MKIFKLLLYLIVRNIRWQIIKLAAKNNEIIKIIKGNKMILSTSRKGADLKEHSIFKQLALDGERESEATKILEKIIKPGQVIFELGANIGYYVLIETNLIGPQGKIYAIEPEPANFALLKRNVEINKLNNVQLFNIAISDQAGNFPFYVTENSNLHSMIEPKDGEYKKVMIKTETVDEFLKGKGEINFIRMDIEGYEYNALRGMRETLEKNPNISLFIELHCNLIGPDKSKAILKDLRAYGFEILYLVAHDNFQRRIMGETTVEQMSINDFCNDPRLLNKQNAFEIFFSKQNAQ
ncbi:MAG: hypothetical protein COY66_00245 [Candidatus Kerfeldbacteria bacterium CG_4_10_14_0_8_um_filter_42_10]|uniref:Methyltransferase FkbM domain-containing protein n=1 Tax=Candidatus Kerfeldbacteria bacterium CG_4_10_14_0_8_um_filter_42_10 TaxID=2014248 RepID=A0A2M7RKM4_9BACT|nr:MAG: hypothetical protein COY66_00245 [Candidatus Kerfeldbacteria bacterium CG_4_10_14_0_8_um_filter_42_10]